MKIKNLKLGLFITTILAILISCGNDDDDNFTFVERDRAEQQVADEDSLQTYFSTHYYNAGFFSSGVDYKIDDIIITDDISEVPNPEDFVLLSEPNVLETHTVTYLETDYKYYILRLNQGSGGKPQFTDIVRARYEGISVESGETFDVVSTPVNFPLTTPVGLGVIKGWELVMPEFDVATSFTTTNGIVNYENYGLGVMFLPSGLGYFSGTNTGTSYDNLIFKFELVQFEEVDHDGDGIPSYLEDIDVPSNRNVFDNDTDEDGLANFIDVDDDNDGTSTINELVPTIYTVNTNNGEIEPTLANGEYEISRSENSGVITINTVRIVDTDNNNVPDYLDADITTDYNETDD